MKRRKKMNPPASQKIGPVCLIVFLVFSFEKTSPKKRTESRCNAFKKKNNVIPLIEIKLALKTLKNRKIFDFLEK